MIYHLIDNRTNITLKSGSVKTVGDYLIEDCKIEKPRKIINREIRAILADDIKRKSMFKHFTVKVSPSPNYRLTLPAEFIKQIEDLYNVHVKLFNSLSVAAIDPDHLSQEAVRYGITHIQAVALENRVNGAMESDKMWVDDMPADFRTYCESAGFVLPFWRKLGFFNSIVDGDKTVFTLNSMFNDREKIVFTVENEFCQNNGFNLKFNPDTKTVWFTSIDKSHEYESRAANDDGPEVVIADCPTFKRIWDKFAEQDKEMAKMKARIVELEKFKEIKEM